MNDHEISLEDILLDLVEEHLHMDDELHTEEAVRLMGRVIDLKQVEMFMGLSLASAFLQMGSVDPCHKFFSIALTAGGQLADHHVERGDQLEELGRLSEAVEDYLSAICLSADNPYFHNRAGIALCGLGRDEEAIVHFDRSVDIMNSHTFDFTVKALAHTGRGEFGLAVHYAEQASMNAFNTARFYTDRGICLSRMKRYDEGIEDFALSAGLARNAENYAAMGEAFLENGDCRDAVSALSEAIGLDPDEGEYFHMRGQANLDLERYAEALSDLWAAVENGADGSGTYLLLGDAYEYLDEYERASQCFEQAVGKAPEDPSTHACLGDALFELGRLDEARACFDKAIYLDPNDAGFYIGRGLVFDGLNNMPAAVEDMKQAHRLDPNNAAAREYLAYNDVSLDEAAAEPGFS